MDRQYYEQLRDASEDDFEAAINTPEHALYDILWDLFETVVIEPAEVFDSDFDSHNRFRYIVDDQVTMEFLPDINYFEKRLGPAPEVDGSGAAGIHLKLMLQPNESCLFAVGLQIWGRPERLAFKRFWGQNRSLVLGILNKARPMVNNKTSLPAMEYANGFEEILDTYFVARDPENFIEFKYPFVQLDETVSAQTFMTYMGLLYHAIKGQCRHHQIDPSELYNTLRDFHAGQLPELTYSLPNVELTVPSEIE